MRNSIYLFIILMICTTCKAQDKRNPLEKVLAKYPEHFKEVVDNKSKYELQIIYTQINRDSLQKPHFKTYKYNVSKNRYFYPASTVKLPVAMLALEKLSKLNIEGLDKYTSLSVGAGRKPQEEVEADSSAANHLPSIAHYIKKMFVVSDNDSFNRLYEFLGQEYINETLWKKGYKNIQVLHRLANTKFEEEDNRYTNPMKFYEGERLIYEQDERYNTKKYASKAKNTLKGLAYIDKEGKKIDAPFDFSRKNYFSLEEMHEVLKATIFPLEVSAKKRFGMPLKDYRFLYKCMSLLPKESKYPKYEEAYHQDSFMKFLMFGDSEEDIPQHIRIFNKVGLSYGFSVDNAYIVDFKNQSEFMLSVVLYTNKNKVLNDSKYEYEEIAFPFMKRLGQAIAEYEKSRPKKYKPDLSNFKLNYEE